MVLKHNPETIYEKLNNESSLLILYDDLFILNESATIIWDNCFKTVETIKNEFDDDDKQLNIDDIYGIINKMLENNLLVNE